MGLQRCPGSVAQGPVERWDFALSICHGAGLLALGLEPGDRIGIWSHNCAEWTLTQFAAAKIGLILTTINPAFRTSELEFALNKVDVRAVIAAERFKSSDYVSMLEAVDAPRLKHSIKMAETRAQLASFEEVAAWLYRANVPSLQIRGPQLQRCTNRPVTRGTWPKGAMLATEIASTMAGW